MLRYARGLFLALTFCCLAAAFFPAGAAAAPTEQYSLVRYWIDSAADEDFLRSNPGLDVVLVKPGVHADIVATPRHLEIIRDSGGRYDVLHDDLPAFYRSRISADKSDNFGIYHNWQEQVAFADSLRLLFPTVISQKWSLGQSHQGRDIWCFRVSSAPDVDGSNPEILFDGIHHAREPMSGEFCLMFAEYLALNYGTDPEVTWLLDHREVYFVPCVNPDGYWFNNWGDMWRKNRRDNPGGCEGVDPNRNYPFEWIGPGSSSDPCDDTYRGPSAGSEPEIQAVMGLINAHQFVCRNSIHTFSNLTLFPWAYTDAPTPDDAIFEHMAGMMTQYNGYTPGQPPEVLYEVNGGSMDWDYGATGEHPRIFSFTNEIGGGGDGFWPPESRRGELFQENIWPAVYLMRVAGAFVDAGGQAVLGGDGNGRLDPGESAGISFVLENQGVQTAATGVTVTLGSDDPYLQLGEAFRDVGTLGPLGTVDYAGDPFPVAVDAACPVGHMVRITATVTQQDGSFARTLSFPVGPPAVVFSANFDFGSAGWTFTGSWGTTGQYSHSPPSSLTDSPGGDYPDNSSTYAATVSGYHASSLSFWHRYVIEDGWDFGYVQISADGGPWTTVASYTGTQNSWTQVNLPLDQFAGQLVRLRFQLVSDTWITEDGWYIDDVVLYGFTSTNQAPAPPVLLTPVPGATVGPTPTVTVANSPDPDGPGPVTYGFRVYGDEMCTGLVASADGVPEGGGQTSWTAPSLVDGTYWWRAYAADPTERGLLGEKRTFQVETSTGVGDGLILGPRLNVLGPLASGQARLRLELPAGAEIRLTIYDARGRLVRRLHSGILAGGVQVLTWDGSDSGGRAAASGLYFARLTLGSQALTERFVLVR